jgi:O-antigen/teichoic acid export membrane protein
MVDTVDSARGTSQLMLQSIISGVFRILNLAVLTRLLFRYEMGVLAVLGIVYGFMQFIGALGLNHASPLVISELESDGRVGYIRSYLYRSTILIIITSSLISLGLFILLPLIVSFSGIAEALYLFLILIAPFSALEVFLDSFLLARYDVSRLTAGRIIFDCARLVGTVLLVLAEMGVAGVVIGWLLSEVVAVILFGLASFHDLPLTTDDIPMKPVLAFAIPSLLFQTVDVTIQNLDRIILHRLTDLDTLGVYDVFLRLLFMLSFLSLALSTSIYPVLTRLRVRYERVGDQVSLERVVSLLARYVLLLLAPIGFIVSLNSHAVLEILFGPLYADFPNASIAFSLLVLGYVLWGLVYAIHTVLRSLGEERFFILVGIGVILFEVVGCWYMTSLLGLFGCAIVRCIYIVMLLLTALLRLKQRGVRSLPNMGLTSMRVVTSSVISGLLVFLIAPQGLLMLLLSVGATLLVYISLLLLFGEAKALDFRLLKAILPVRLHGLLDTLSTRFASPESEVQI